MSSHSFTSDFYFLDGKVTSDNFLRVSLYKAKNTEFWRIQQNPNSYNLKKGVIRIFLTVSFLRKTEISQRLGFFFKFYETNSWNVFLPKEMLKVT